MATDADNSFFQARNVGLLNRARVFTDSVSSSDRFDFYGVRLANRSNFRGKLTQLSDNVDLALFNSDFQRIALSKSPGNQTESITTVLDRGVYYVRVRRQSGSPTYRLRLSATSPPDLAGNNQSSARAIAIGATPTPFSDAVGGTDPGDFYQITTTAFGNLSLNLSGLNADANVQLLNDSGAVIRSSTASGITPEAINAGVQAGNYFIRVFPGASGVTTNYTLNLALTPLTMIGLTDNNALVSFNLGNSNNATSVNVTGLAPGERLLGIDVRPATGELFGLGNSNRLYLIDPTTGAATTVGTTSFSPTLDGAATAFGTDFNPAADRFRVVSDGNQNLRLNPNNGTVVDADANTAGIQTDPNLTYDTSDQNTGRDPTIVATAYTNNQGGATSTTQFGIDSNLNILVRQGSPGGIPTSPNAGRLFTIGTLGVDFSATAGFDIFTDGSGVDYAFATSNSTLYSINLSIGAASNLGTISVGSTPVNLIGLTSRP
jgi:hypothetical protein